jgi:hypothetical protein
MACLYWGSHCAYTTSNSSFICQTSSDGADERVVEHRLLKERHIAMNRPSPPFPAPVRSPSTWRVMRLRDFVEFDGVPEPMQQNREPQRCRRVLERGQLLLCWIAFCKGNHSLGYCVEGTAASPVISYRFWVSTPRIPALQFSLNSPRTVIR